MLASAFWLGVLILLAAVSFCLAVRDFLDNFFGE